MSRWTMPKKRIDSNIPSSKWLVSQKNYAREINRRIKIITMPLTDFYKLLGTNGTAYTLEHPIKGKLCIIRGMQYNVRIEDYLSVEHYQY